MNNQQVGKIIGFFRIHHQFHDPYQIILDGNFIKLLVEKQMDFKRKFENAVAGKATLRVTDCILRELQLLGDHFRLVLSKAKQFKSIHCKHPLEQTVDQCIMEQIGQENERKIIVCSQDLQLRRCLRQFGNVPLVYFGPDQRVTMEDVHKDVLRQVEREGEKKFLPQGKEVKQVRQFKKEQELLQKKKWIKKISSQQGIKIKTKIARGPNPLSVKKKKKVPFEPNEQSAQKHKLIHKQQLSMKSGQQN